MRTVRESTACPDCGGVLAEISLPSISYFRCHVGHQFGLKTLVAAQAVTGDLPSYRGVSPGRFLIPIAVGVAALIAVAVWLLQG